MSKGICKGKDALVGIGGPSVKEQICIPVVTPPRANSSVDTNRCLSDLEDSFAKLVGETKGLEGILRDAESSDIGIGGKGALDKTNTEGKVRSRRQSFDVVDGTDSSVVNGRSQGIEGIKTKGDGGFHDVGGLNCHMSVFIDCIFDKRDMYNNLSMYCPMSVPRQVPLQYPSKSALTQKVADQDFGRTTVERGVDVERR